MKTSKLLLEKKRLTVTPEREKPLSTWIFNNDNYCKQINDYYTLNKSGKTQLDVDYYLFKEEEWLLRIFDKWKSCFNKNNCILFRIIYDESVSGDKITIVRQILPPRAYILILGKDVFANGNNLDLHPLKAWLGANSQKSYSVQSLKQQTTKKCLWLFSIIKLRKNTNYSRQYFVSKIVSKKMFGTRVSLPP